MHFEQLRLHFSDLVAIGLTHTHHYVEILILGVTAMFQTRDTEKRLLETGTMLKSLGNPSPATHKNTN